MKEIVEECRSVIKKFDIERLLGAVITNSIESISKDEKEIFCAGMIKLGEALTYCRDRGVNAIKASGIANVARDYADVRNYFVHHYMYDHLLSRGEKLKEKLEKLCMIDVLTKKLSDLENTGFSLLSKEIDKSKKIFNKFDFEYAHFVVSLKNEFEQLNKGMENVVDEKSINEVQNVFLDNRVRNILSIMVDLLDTEKTSTNLHESCSREKKIAADFNMQFKSQNEEFGDFFATLKLFRNGLCHSDGNLAKPYDEEDKVGLLKFVRKLQDLYKKGYLNGLEEHLLALQKEGKRVGQPTVAPQAESLPRTSKSESDAQKKVKVVKSKEAGGLEKLRLAYGTVEKKESEPTKLKDSEKVASPPDAERLRKVSSSNRYVKK